MRALIAVAAVLLVACDSHDTAAPAPVQSRHQSAVDGIAANLIQQFPVPAVAVAIVHGTGEPSIAVAGVRRLGTADRVTLNDRWHLGSNVKAMTVAMIARLVESGRLSWDDTPGKLFPELRSRISPALRDVRLTQLLSHRAGVIADTSAEELLAHPVFPGSPAAQRLAYALEVLELGPARPVGTYAYANADYTIATAMAERATGTSWEELMRRYLYAPMRIDAIVGWPAANGRIGPWGHTDDGGQLTPHNPDGPERVPVIVGSAGDVSVPIRDYARFVQSQLAGLEGRTGLLRSTTVGFMHSDPEGIYALGWGLTTIAGLPTSYHNGSAGPFRATAVVIPRLDVAVIVFVNAGSEPAVQAIDAAIIMLLNESVRGL